MQGKAIKAPFLSRGHGKALPAQKFLCCRLSAALTADCRHCQPASRRPSISCERRWLHSNLPHSTDDCTSGLWCNEQRTAALDKNWHFGHIHVSVSRHHLQDRCLDKGAALGHTSNAWSAVGCPLQAVDAVICFASKSSQVFRKCGYAVLGAAHFQASIESPAQPLCSQAGMQSSSFVGMRVEPLSCVREARGARTYAMPLSGHFECMHVLQAPCHISLLSDKQFEGCARGTESPVWQPCILAQAKEAKGKGREGEEIVASPKRA